MSMKLFATSLVFMCCLSITFAQVNDSQTGFKIDPIDSTKRVDSPFSYKFSQLLGLTTRRINYTLNYKPLPEFNKKTTGVDMTAKSSLVDKEWKIKQRFSEDSKDLGKFAKDYYLGDLTTTHKTLIIKCRDHEYVDGDRIKLMVNNAIVHPNLELRGDFYVIDIDLKEGFNTINFVALNEGLSSPNTAQVQVYDPDGNLLASNRWLIRTGFKASLFIIKQ